MKSAYRAIMCYDEEVGRKLMNYLFTYKGSGVKKNRTWRKKRHLKNLYRPTALTLYRGYRRNQYEIELTKLGVEPRERPSGHRGEVLLSFP